MYIHAYCIQLFFFVYSWLGPTYTVYMARLSSYCIWMVGLLLLLSIKPNIWQVATRMKWIFSIQTPNNGLYKWKELNYISKKITLLMKREVLVFLTAIGIGTYKTTAPAKLAENYNDLVATLIAYLKPKPQTIAEKLKFHKRNQVEGHNTYKGWCNIHQVWDHLLCSKAIPSVDYIL